MRRSRTALPLVATLLLAACSPAGKPAPRSPSPSPRPSPTALPSVTASPPALSRCGSPAPRQAECGSLQVPLDYAHPERGSIQLAVIVLPATEPQSRIGAVLVNPGGPGGSGVQFLSRAAALFTKLNRSFDIVSWDPRGISGPDAVACTDTATMDRLVDIDPIADDPGEHQALVDGARTLAQACAQTSARLLPYVGSDNVARDMDTIRAALGESTLTYLGFSYGTDLGARYAAMFPTHVRAMVLDGDIDPSLSALDAVTQQADALEASFQEFVARCRADAKCPLNPNPAAVVDGILQHLDAHPAVVGGRSYGRGSALVALLAAMYQPSQWPQVEIMFAYAARGDYAQMQELTDAYTGRKPSGEYDHSQESGSAVDCADSPAPPDFAHLDHAAAAAQQRDPHFGDAAVYGISPCLFWPVHGPAPTPLHVSGTPTILLVGATHDPATPLAWSQSLQRQIDGSVLITRDGYGHTSYPNSTCIADAVNAYLATLQAPADGMACSS